MRPAAARLSGRPGGVRRGHGRAAAVPAGALAVLLPLLCKDLVATFMVSRALVCSKSFAAERRLGLCFGILGHSTDQRMWRKPGGPAVTPGDLAGCVSWAAYLTAKSAVQMAAAGLQDSAADHACSHLGKAVAIATILRGTGHHARRCFY